MSIDENAGLDEPLKVTLTKLTAENIALKFALAALIRVLSEPQRSLLLRTLTSLAKASDLYNAELSAFSVGEEATHTIRTSLAGIVDMASKVKLGTH
jgi:hypothetical protein